MNQYQVEKLSIYIFIISSNKCSSVSLVCIFCSNKCSSVSLVCIFCSNKCSSVSLVCIFCFLILVVHTCYTYVAKVVILITWFHYNDWLFDALQPTTDSPYIFRTCVWRVDSVHCRFDRVVKCSFTSNNFRVLRFV